MAVILNMNELLEALAACEGIPEAEAAPLAMACEAAARGVAEALAKAEGVQVTDVSDQQGFGGLCATFNVLDGGDGSDFLSEYDPGGEWE